MDRADTPIIYTVGHSTHPIKYFIELLVSCGVNCVVDVRSLAASRFNPQYNKKAFAASLDDHNITYIHLPEEFGARQTDPAILDTEGRVDFGKVRASEKFKDGVRRLWREVDRQFTIALMCSESEPLHCHRFAMISPALMDFDVRHILKDKSVIGQRQLENELIELYSKKKQPDMFASSVTESERLRNAYKILNREVAYSPAQHRRGFRR